MKLKPLKNVSMGSSARVCVCVFTCVSSACMLTPLICEALLVIKAFVCWHFVLMM